MSHVLIALILVVTALAPGLACGESSPADDARLVDVRRIWDKANHNAFTDLIRFRGQWFCVFREGEAHLSGEGKLRVLVSEEGRSWRSAALISRPGVDLRDAKIMTTPDDRLMLAGAAAPRRSSSGHHQSLTWFSDDGVHWGDAHQVGDKDIWIWRTVWRGELAYGIGYGTGDKRGVLRLYRTSDGQSFETLVPDLLEGSYPNEAALLFRDHGAATCLVRRDGSEKTALLGKADPPYRDWTWEDLGVRVGGPQMIELPDGRTVAAVRRYDGRVRTSLCWLDTEAAGLTEFLRLPSGGDTSYAGMAWHEGRLWVSYYSSHEQDRIQATASIYLAEVAFDEP